MFVYHGRKVAKIKEFTDNTQYCTSCKSFDLRIKVFREYYHVYLIPIIPIGDNVIDIRCNQCQAPILLESLKKEYAKKAKAPVYLYSLFILFGLLLAWVIYAEQNDKNNTIRFVADPKAGDVYIIKREQTGATSWSFLKAASVAGDTVLVYHNSLEYSGYVSKFNSEDYFESGEKLYYTKKELKQFLDKGEILEVKRGYGEEEGFNRFK
jgi:hypothetical protein